MPLTCEPEDWEDSSWAFWHPTDYTILSGKRRRCSSCYSLIEVGSVVLEFEIMDMTPDKKGNAKEKKKPSKFFCEECGDLYFSFTELGYHGLTPEENMKELLEEYVQIQKREGGKNAE